MFKMLKFFIFAVIAVLVSVFVVPVFTGYGADEAGDVAQFEMKVPSPKPSSRQAVPTLEQIKALAANSGSDGLSLNFSALKNLASQNPEDLIAAIKAGTKEDIPENTEQMVIAAVEKAREMIEKDGLFVQPGHTKPQE